ncbi:MAG TPA: hypothetical protein VFI08_13360, partial [Spirochaetia bacterium]|nr:hypothetical protein [Spirochaetia bacterium]
MSKRLILVIAVSVIFLSSAGIVTFLSAQEGGGSVSTVETRAAALPVPLETKYAPDKVVRTTGPAVWRLSRDFGLLVSSDGGATWTPRNQGLPVRAVYPFTVEKPMIITGLAVDPLDTSRLAVTSLDSLFVSSDEGVTWKRAELKEPLKPNDQLTCVAVDPGVPGTIAIGTSFHGFFETKDRGKTWASLSEALT